MRQSDYSKKLRVMEAELLRATSDGTFKILQEISDKDSGSSEFHAKPGYETAVKGHLRDLNEIEKEVTRRGGWHNLNDYDLKQARRRERAKSVATKALEPISWLGTARDFADAIFKLYKKNLIRGKDWVDAVRMFCPHFVDKEGNEFDPESIRESIRDREKKGGKGGPGEQLKLDS